MFISPEELKFELVYHLSIIDLPPLKQDQTALDSKCSLKTVYYKPDLQRKFLRVGNRVSRLATSKLAQTRIVRPAYESPKGIDRNARLMRKKERER